VLNFLDGFDEMSASSSSTNSHVGGPNVSRILITMRDAGAVSFDRDLKAQFKALPETYLAVLKTFFFKKKSFSSHDLNTMIFKF